MKEPITYFDTVYDEETVQQITTLRHERWALYAVLSMQPVRQAGTIFTERQVIKCEKRLRVVNATLFEITNNPIYNA